MCTAVGKGNRYAAGRLVVVSFLALPNPALRKTVMFAMSVPQLLTAIAGILLAEQIKKRLCQFNLSRTWNNITSLCVSKYSIAKITAGVKAVRLFCAYA